MFAAERTAAADAAAAAEAAAAATAAAAAADAAPPVRTPKPAARAAPETPGRIPRQRPAPVNARAAAVRLVGAFENDALRREVDRFRATVRMLLKEKGEGEGKE
ncbi:hypothetical protein DL768_011393 [Monosporascus sp. mg162]|nr:hypothetical protein DL768_011393 [Monosporascus sp. mg162]